MVNKQMTDDLKAQIDRARAQGKILDETEPRAIDAWYEEETGRVFIELKTGVIVGFPYQKLQGLENATSQQLAEVDVTPTGYGLHWESLDVDLGVPQLMAGLFGTKAWMTELGRQGGKSRSDAKAQASRENGKRGGRPRKTALISKSDELLSIRNLASTEKLALSKKKKQGNSEVQEQK
jgi:hypothetical protein